MVALMAIGMALTPLPEKSRIPLDFHIAGVLVADLSPELPDCAFDCMRPTGFKSQIDRLFRGELWILRMR